MIDRLADNILLELLPLAPQLSLVNRRLYFLGELSFKTRLNVLMDEQEIDEIFEESKDSMRSYGALYAVMQSGLWVFKPEHLIDSMYSRHKPLILNNMPFGLQVNGMHTLQYNGKLMNGNYDLFIEGMFDAFVLSSLSVQVLHAKQHFKPSPHKQEIQKQLNGIEECRWRIGTITVINKFTVLLDVFLPESRGVVLNYISFEPVNKISEIDWVLDTLNCPATNFNQIHKRTGRLRPMASLACDMTT